jgi:hypothetical protein
MAARLVGVLLACSLGLAACGSGVGDRDRVAADPAGAQTDAHPETALAPTSTPPGGRQPAAADPLRVVFAGDSLGIEMAAPAMAALRGGGSTVSFFVDNPGIPRGPLGGLFWSKTLAESDPEVVVLLIGVWERVAFNEARLDGQTLSQYRAEVIDPFVDLVTSHGAEIVWVSSPLVREPTPSAQLSFMNELFHGVGESDDRIEYIDASSRITGPSGEHLDVMTGPGDTLERLRRLDGTHLCPGGAHRIAEPVIQYVVDRWNVPVDDDWANGAWRAAEPFENVTAECPVLG